MPNLVEILSQHNVEFRQYGDHHHTTKNRVNIDCPYCSPDSGRFRLGFHLSSGKTNCWICGSKNQIDALAKVCKIHYQQAASILEEVSYQHYEKPKHTGSLKLPKGIQNIGIPHKKYLEKRGFSPDEIEKLWDIQGIWLSSTLAWRLFIPIHNKQGEVVSWTTRALTENSKAKYISASSDQEAIPHKNLLYGAHLARQTIVIVEGPLDAWAIGPGAVATCGLSYSIAQLKLMSEYSNRIICFDSEKNAQKRADKLYNELLLFGGTTINVRLETGSDPADADKEEIQELRKEFLQEFE